MNAISRMMANLGEHLGLEDVKQMVRDADFDGDGKINYDDFVKMMMNWLVTGPSILRGIVKLRDAFLCTQ